MYAKDYKINAGQINWSKCSLTGIEYESADLFYIKKVKTEYLFFCKTREDANYLKLRFPEWIL